MLWRDINCSTSPHIHERLSWAAPTLIKSSSKTSTWPPWTPARSIWLWRLNPEDFLDLSYPSLKSGNRWWITAHLLCCSPHLLSPLLAVKHCCGSTSSFYSTIPYSPDMPVCVQPWQVCQVYQLDSQSCRRNMTRTFFVLFVHYYYLQCIYIYIYIFNLYPFHVPEHL